MLKREILNDLNKLTNILCSWIRKLSIAKLLILPKLMYRLKRILITIQGGLFLDIGKVIL